MENILGKFMRGEFVNCPVVSVCSKRFVAFKTYEVLKTS